MKTSLCKLITPEIVKLPIAEARYLSAPGDKTGDTPAAINLLCESGDTSANVKCTFTDASISTNTTLALDLTEAASTESGLAIQVLDNNAPINFGPDSSLAGTTNQRHFATITSAGGLVGKSFTARYLRTASPIDSSKRLLVLSYPTTIDSFRSSILFMLHAFQKLQ